VPRKRVRSTSPSGREMRTMENLKELVRSLVRLPTETSWVEFKKNYYDPEMIGQRICGLANAAALEDRRTAYIVWGIDDATHEITGTEGDFPTVRVGEKDEMEPWLRQRLSRNVDFSYDTAEIDGKKIGVVFISPATGYPVSFHNTEYIRMGSITRKLAEFKELSGRLWSKLREGCYELRDAKIDCDEQFIVESLDVVKYFALKNLPYPSDRSGVMHYLLDDELIRKQDNGLYAVTNLGAILLAKDMRAFGAVGRKELRIVTYKDNSRMELEKAPELHGGYAIVFETAIKMVALLTPGGSPIVNGIRTPLSAYPEIPVREALANALIHQDFTESGSGPVLEIFPDRIEFSNPGAPLVAVERIIDTTPKSRNEKLASLMRHFHLCEELGTGWDKIVLGCEIARLPPPRIQLYENGTRLTLNVFRPYSDWPLEDRLMACYYHACIKFVLNEHLTNSSLRERLGVPASSAGSVSRVITEAMNRKLIKPLDPMAGNRYMKYMPIWA